MPQVSGAPRALNELLEEVYNDCLKTGKSKAICSASAWSVAERAGWFKGKDDKWRKKSLDEIVELLKEREKAFTQTILLSRKRFKTREAAVAWLKEHNKKYADIDETEEYWRARQRDPGDFRRETFRTHEIAAGIKIIIGRLKK